MNPLAFKVVDDLSEYNWPSPKNDSTPCICIVFQITDSSDISISLRTVSTAVCPRSADIGLKIILSVYSCL